jgi:hypothetical protein
MTFELCGTEHVDDYVPLRRLLQTSQISSIPEGIWLASNLWVFQNLSATVEPAGRTWHIQIFSAVVTHLSDCLPPPFSFSWLASLLTRPEPPDHYSYSSRPPLL